MNSKLSCADWACSWETIRWRVYTSKSIEYGFSQLQLRQWDGRIRTEHMHKCKCQCLRLPNTIILWVVAFKECNYYCHWLRYVHLTIEWRALFWYRVFWYVWCINFLVCLFKFHKFISFQIQCFLAMQACSK